MELLQEDGTQSLIETLQVDLTKIEEQRGSMLPIDI